MDGRLMESPSRCCEQISCFATPSRVLIQQAIALSDKMPAWEVNWLRRRKHRGYSSLIERGFFLTIRHSTSYPLKDVVLVSRFLSLSNSAPRANHITSSHQPGFCRNLHPSNEEQLASSRISNLAGLTIAHCTLNAHTQSTNLLLIGAESITTHRYHLRRPENTAMHTAPLRTIHTAIIAC